MCQIRRTPQGAGRDEIRVHILQNLHVQTGPASAAGSHATGMIFCIKILYHSAKSAQIGSKREAMWRPKSATVGPKCHPGSSSTKTLQKVSENYAKMEAWHLQNHAFRLKGVALLQFCSICKQVCKDIQKQTQ